MKEIFPFLENIREFEKICLFTAIVETFCVMHKIYIMDRSQFERRDEIHYEWKKNRIFTLAHQKLIQTHVKHMYMGLSV